MFLAKFELNRTIGSKDMAKKFRNLLIYAHRVPGAITRVPGTRISLITRAGTRDPSQAYVGERSRKNLALNSYVPRMVVILAVISICGPSSFWALGIPMGPPCHQISTNLQQNFVIILHCL